MLGWLKNMVASWTSVGRRGIRASFDNISRDKRLDAYWANADGLSARAANSPDVRKKFRDRTRYEYANNSYCQGCVLTIANELIGRGPRLQMRLPGGNRDANRLIERLWTDWGNAACFNEKLHCMAQAIVRDGEAPARMFFNPASRSKLQLDLDIFEADRLATPWQTTFTPTELDGIRFDQFGNPTQYSVLRYHPGDIFQFGNPAAHDWIDARWILHWYRADRPGQVRGLPWISSCLGLFAQLRRWTLAVLTAAETAANFSAILYTEQSPETDQAEPRDLIPITAGMLMSLPGNWKMDQFDAKQPQATYDAFKKELLKEIARCLNMPFNVVTGDSSNYNYASGRLDYQNWHRMLRVSRSHFERTILEKIFSLWCEEVEVRGLLPSGLTAADLPHGWFWDAVQHVDPVKDGTGDALALVNNTDTLANICAAQGLDWEEVLEQRSIEQSRMRELGLTEMAVTSPKQAPQDLAQEDMPQPPPKQASQRFWDHCLHESSKN